MCYIYIHIYIYIYIYMLFKEKTIKILIKKYFAYQFTLTFAINLSIVIKCIK